MKPFIFYIFFFSFSICRSQSTYVVDAAGNINSVDMANGCATKFIARCDHNFIVDIAADAAGNIYVCSNDSLFVLKANNPAAGFVYLGQFPTSVNGLVVAGDGYLYASGEGLNRYDPATGTFTFLGIFSHSIRSAGDMVEYNGEIYLAADDGIIYKINREFPSLSTAFYEIGPEGIYGMALIATSCYGDPVAKQKVLAFAPTQNGTQTYLIDMEAKINFPSFCNLKIFATGATSVNESTVTAGPITIASVATEPPACNQIQNGRISIAMANSAVNVYSYSVDDKPAKVNPVFDSLASGSHTIRIKNQFGCFRDTVIKIPFSNVDCRDTLFIPTAFTPDGNGLNDIFKVTTILPVKNFELNIFNRYGERVYISHNTSQGWNGMFRSVLQPTGVYVWVVQYRNFAGKDLIRKGLVTLIR
ncbi:MAG: gliding motility-associated C-terminal domain-containing protein [Chitinophagaceae bacterium]